MNPYQNLPNRCFWKNEVSEQNFADLEFPDHVLDFEKYKSISAYGSCFAQYLVKELKQSMGNFLDCEPPPEKLHEVENRNFGYELFSSRSGNIYTPRHLLQCLEFSIQGKDWIEDCIFEKEGRFFDGFRPGIWPVGTKSRDVIIKDRAVHSKCFERSIRECDLFVFTFGLIENWTTSDNEYVLPLAPGVKFGEFDEKKFPWHRESLAESLNHMRQFIDLAKCLNSKLDFLFTLSPVPLTATFANESVLIANTISKATLRVAVAEIVKQYEDVHYFPSYELVTNPASRGVFYNSNLRTVSNFGVSNVMEKLFQKPMFDEKEDLDLICDEEQIDTR